MPLVAQFTRDGRPTGRELTIPRTIPQGRANDVHLDFDRGADVRDHRLVESLAGDAAGEGGVGNLAERVGSVAGGRGERDQPCSGGSHAAGGVVGPRPPKSIVTSSPLPLARWPLGAASASAGAADCAIGVSTPGRAAVSVLSPWPMPSSGSPTELRDWAGISAGAIAEAVRAALG